MGGSAYSRLYQGRLVAHRCLEKHLLYLGVDLCPVIGIKRPDHLADGEVIGQTQQGGLGCIGGLARSDERREQNRSAENSQLYSLTTG